MGAAACGMAARALAEALRHARGRSQFGKPLAEFQLVQTKLARMAKYSYKFAPLVSDRLTGELVAARLDELFAQPPSRGFH